jgi:hypothetical protein
MAIIIQHTIKVVVPTVQENPAIRDLLLAEIRELVRLYLASAQGSREE